MNRAQQIIPSMLVAMVGLAVCFVSYTQEPSDAFLFPRLISTAFAGLALWTLARAIIGSNENDKGINRVDFLNLVPGFLVMVIYVFWAAKSFGFYTATAIAFLIVLSLYDPGSHRDWKVWGKRLIITACFVAVMYGLFAKLLKVYTPREVFF
jgi:asparagine N-glycosylation enzyme membrane subunit Stt3